MEKKLNLEREIEIGQKSAGQAKELYELLSSYNAYSILLREAKMEYERKKENVKKYYTDCDCYRNQISGLFSLFKNNECIRGNQLSRRDCKDMLFLIDRDNLLRINSFDDMNSDIGGLSVVDYTLLKINNCKFKLYKENIYCNDPYYCESYTESKEAFGLFYDETLITPSYEVDNRLRKYDNMDVRDILKQQSIDEIYEKITNAKNIKTKKLVLNQYQKSSN